MFFLEGNNPEEEKKNLWQYNYIMTKITDDSINEITI